jgi:hypothetical protein
MKMKKHGLNFILVLMLLAGLFCLTPVTSFAETNDPSTVMKGLAGALDKGDIEGALAFFTDDAVVTEIQPGSNLTNERKGKEEIRAMYQEATAWKPRVSLVGEPKLTGEKVMATIRFSTPQNIQAAGVEYFDFSGEVVMSNGKIQTLRSGMTEETMSKMQAAMSKAPASQNEAPQLAATNAPAASSNSASATQNSDNLMWWLVAGGLVVVLGGLASFVWFRRSAR